MAKRTWGSICRRRRRDGSLYDGWWIRYRNADGKRTTAFGGATVEDAEQEANRLRRDVERERAGAVAHLRVADVVLEYEPLLAARVHAKTRRDVMVHLGRAAEAFGDRPMADITAADVEGFLLGLLGYGRAVRTVMQYRRSLSGLWRYARGRRLVTENVCRDVSLPQPEERALPWIEPDDLERLFASCEPWLRPLIVLLAETGLRIGEALALQWVDVSTAFDRVTVRRSKTGIGRVVPLTPRAQETLRAVHEGRGAVPLRGEDAVFGGIRYSPRLHYGFRLAVGRARLPHLRLHDLRKIAASHLVRAGVPIPAAAEVTGHRNLAVFLRTYGRFAPTSAATQATAALARFRGQAPPPGESTQGTRGAPPAVGD